jgi:hypothetical protein
MLTYDDVAARSEQKEDLMLGASDHSLVVCAFMLT